MKNRNIAMIGCGRIGFLLEADPLRYKPCTHMGGARSAGLQINYACDINIERLHQFAGIAGISIKNTYASYNKLIEEIRPEMVIISSWTGSHAGIGIMASKNGAKVIICEKPICSNLTDAKKLVNECKKNRTSLIVNHERRYDARYMHLKKLIESKKIGEIKTVHASILNSGYRGKSNIEEGGGPLLHDGTHMIDMIRYLFGEIESVEGELSRSNRKNGFEDRALAWITMKNGITIFLEAGGNRKYFIFELAISGTDGKIVIGNGYEKLFLPGKSAYYTGFNDLSETGIKKSNGMNYFKREYIEAKNLLNGKNITITSNSIDAYKALEAINAIYLSSHLGRKRIALPIKPDIINIKEIFNL